MIIFVYIIYKGNIEMARKEQIANFNIYKLNVQVKILTMCGWCEKNQTTTAVPRIHCSRNDNSLWRSYSMNTVEKSQNWNILRTVGKTPLQ